MSFGPGPAPGSVPLRAPRLTYAGGGSGNTQDLSHFDDVRGSEAVGPGEDVKADAVTPGNAVKGIAALDGMPLRPGQDDSLTDAQVIGRAEAVGLDDGANGNQVPARKCVNRVALADMDGVGGDE